VGGRELRRSTLPKTTRLHNGGGVCERNKKELNTLDEADFVRDVDKFSKVICDH